MNRLSLDNNRQCVYNFHNVSNKSDIYANLIREPEENDSESVQLSMMLLSQSDVNRLRIFFGSRFNEPLICKCTVSVFMTYNLHLSNCSVTDINNTDNWRPKTQGAILLQINYDKELPQEVCGGRLIVANTQSCDTSWSTKLYSWNRYQCIDENFHVFFKLSKNEKDEDQPIPRDFAIGIYFTNSKAAQQFYEFIVEYNKRVVVHDNRDSASKIEAIKNLKVKNRSKKKSEMLRKSMISAPVMFTHTLHVEK